MKAQLRIQLSHHCSIILFVVYSNTIRQIY